MTKQPSTYLDHAIAAAEVEAQGRFKKQSPTTIVGATTPQYPKQPTSSPWSRGLDELTGREGPLEIDIDFVGELGGASAPASSPCAVETASSTRGASPTALAGAPPFLRRRV
jgi:hypothetical protein